MNESEALPAVADLFGLAAKHGVGPIWAVSCLLLSVSVYAARKAIAAWIEARGSALKARDVTVLDKFNGSLDGRIDARVKIITDEIRLDFARHEEKSGEVTDRVTKLEADVRQGGRRIAGLEEEVKKLGKDLAGHTGEMKVALRTVEKKLDTQDAKMDTQTVKLSQILARLQRPVLVPDAPSGDEEK